MWEGDCVCQGLGLLSDSELIPEGLVFAHDKAQSLPLQGI